MPNPFASGRHALAICDNCGRTLKYRDLRRDVLAQRPTGSLVCDDCWDRDHPQLMLGRFRIEDPIALKNARPDQKETQGLMGFDPITGLGMTIEMGHIYAITDWPDEVPTEVDWMISVPGPAISLDFEMGDVTVES